MPGTIVPAQSFDHQLDGRKGWPSPYALDKTVQADTLVTGIAAGMGLYLDSVSGLAKRGHVNGVMALFAFQNQNDFDVNGDVGNTIGNNINTLVATGAYELETTEFVGVAFAPNDVLSIENGAGVDQGKLRLAVGGLAGAEGIVGVVSEAGPDSNEHGVSVLRFWPVYLPKR